MKVLKQLYLAAKIEQDKTCSNCEKLIERNPTVQEKVLYRNYRQDETEIQFFQKEAKKMLDIEKVFGCQVRKTTTINPDKEGCNLFKAMVQKENGLLSTL